MHYISVSFSKICSVRMEALPSQNVVSGDGGESKILAFENFYSRNNKSVWRSRNDSEGNNIILDISSLYVKID